MNQILTLLLLCVFIVRANEVLTTHTSIDNEYMYIKPISIETAPIAKVIESTQLNADHDNDGVADKYDMCKNTKLSAKVNKDGCLIFQDADKDGVPDKDDICPSTIEGINVDKKGCELDSDEDGVVDSKDKCSQTSKEFKVDDNGCPKTATLNVSFAANKFNVDEKLISQLEDFALFLKNNAGYDVIIYGYTDSSGDSEENKKLSQRRADAVKEALTKHNISSFRITAIGKGKENPIADNKTKEGRAKNRRIEVELLY